MHRLVTALATLAAALALAGAASAKQIERLQACGLDGCVDVRVPQNPEAIVDVGAAAAGPTRGGPGFIRLRITVGDGAGHHERFSQLYVPERSLLAFRDDAGAWQWSQAPGASVAALREVASSVRPLPAARLPQGAARSVGAPAAKPASTERAGVADGRGGVPTWVVIVVAAALIALAARGGWTALRPPRR